MYTLGTNVHVVLADGVIIAHRSDYMQNIDVCLHVFYTSSSWKYAQSPKNYSSLW